jgi:hypothetical protein
VVAFAPAATPVIGSAASLANTGQITWAVPAGHHLYAIFTRSGGLATGAMTSVTDSAGNTWTMVTRGAVSSGVNSRVELWQRLANPNAITWVQGNASVAQSWAWILLDYTGPPDAVLDVASPDGSAVASSVTIATPAITTTKDGDLILAAIHHSLTTSTLQGSTLTALSNFDDSTIGSGRGAYQNAGAIGSWSATWTLGVAKAAGVLIAAWKGTTETSAATGAVRLKKMSVAAAGAGISVASGGPRLKKMGITGSVTVSGAPVQDISGGVRLKKMSVSATGAGISVFSGGPRLKKMSVSGTGTGITVVSGGPRLKKMGITGAGAGISVVSGGPRLKKMGIAGAGVGISVVSGGPRLKKMGVSATGAGFSLASGGVRLKKMSVYGTTAKIGILSGDVSLKRMRLAGSGSGMSLASGGPRLKKMGVSGTGAGVSAVSGGLRLKKMAVSGSGTVQQIPVVSGDVRLKKMTILSTGAGLSVASGGVTSKKMRVRAIAGAESLIKPDSLFVFSPL